MPAEDTNRVETRNSKIEQLQEQVIAMRKALRHMVPGYHENWREQMDIDKDERKRKRENDVNVKQKKSKIERNEQTKQTTKIQDGDSAECACGKVECECFEQSGEESEEMRNGGDVESFFVGFYHRTALQYHSSQFASY